jgi:hypothetical protein
MSLYLRSLLDELAIELRNTKEEEIIVFTEDKDGIPIQTPGYVYGKINGITFIEIHEELK